MPAGGSSTLRLQLRCLLPLVLDACLALPLTDRLTLRWFARDLDPRGDLVTNSLSDAIAGALRDPQGGRRRAPLERAVPHERLVVIASCSPQGVLLQHNGNFWASLDCGAAAQLAAQPKPGLRLPSGPVQASGLVAAVQPVLRACSDTWIAHGAGSADRELVDAHGRVAVPPGRKGTRCAGSG